MMTILMMTNINLNEVLESERPGQFLYYYALDNGRLDPKWERLFLEYKDVWYITLYAQDVIQDRWSEAEPILLEYKDVWYITLYAEYAIKNRWPEAEPLIRQSKWWIKYCQHFNIKEEDGHK